MSKRANLQQSKTPIRQAISVVQPIMEPQLEHAISSHDEALLERARTQWQFGDWDSLAQINRDALQHHPARAELALLAAAGRLQTEKNNSEARRFIRLAQNWGASKKLISRILIAGVYNSLGRAAAIGNQPQRALQHFEKAITTGLPGCDAGLLTRARADEQLHQLGLTNLGGFVKVGSDVATYQMDLQVPPDETINESSETYGSFSSARYWDERYKKGGISGYGSYGRLAEFKSKIVNKFIIDKRIKTIIDLGCGDGNQLSMINVSNYIGIDVSQAIVDKCKMIFANDNSKIFFSYDEFKAHPVSAELTLSLDVLFHLVEEKVFEDYVTKLFGAAEKYCIIYACDEEWIETDAIHVRRRKFTEWIKKYIPSWRLSQVIYNEYPHDGSPNPKESSFSNFYFFERLA